MDLRYVNSRGVELNLTQWPYMYSSGDIYDFMWSYNMIAGSVSQITEFYKGLLEMPIKISVTADTEEEFINAVNFLFETTEMDVVNLSPGRLYLGDMYMKCYIRGIKKAKFNAGIEFMFSELNVVTDAPFWVTEQTYQFKARSEQQTKKTREPEIVKENTQFQELPENVILPEFEFDFSKPPKSKTICSLFDLPFNFVKQSGVEMIQNTSISDSDFVMTIYGYALKPSITIAGNPYTVDATVYEGERLVIDSKNSTVIKIGRFGEITDLYNSRGKVYSVFKKIPVGFSRIVWPGTYGFDLTVYDERSEPKWNL